MKAMIIALLACSFLVNVNCYKGTTEEPTCVTFNCLVQPCASAKCYGVPEAVCENNYCNGCNAKWTYNGQDVTDRCNLGTKS
ncbi:hypothetical protein BsWGS_08286 [Bradybaena similaris]